MCVVQAAPKASTPRVANEISIGTLLNDTHLVPLSGRVQCNFMCKPADLLLFLANFAKCLDYKRLHVDFWGSSPHYLKHWNDHNQMLTSGFLLCPKSCAGRCWPKGHTTHPGVRILACFNNTIPDLISKFSQWIGIRASKSIHDVTMYPRVLAIFMTDRLYSLRLTIRLYHWRMHGMLSMSRTCTYICFSEYALSAMDTRSERFLNV